MKKLDKKQIPQFVALCILSSGVFGYFVMRMVTPSPAAASTAVHPSSPVPVAAAVPASSAKPSLAAASATNPAAAPVAVGTPPLTDPAQIVTPPTPGMRDPFVIGYVDPKTAAATTPSAAPPLQHAPVQEARATVPGLSTFPAPVAPGLPTLTDLTVRPTQFAVSLPSVPALPAAPAPPSWLVTGVLQTDTDKLAILRNGESRRIVRSGDFVDSIYRVADVTRSCVVLRHGTFTYRLLLGGDKPAAAPSLPPASFSAPPTFTAPPMFTPPPASLPPPPRRAPAGRPGVPDAAALSQAGRSLHRLAQLWLRTSPVLPVHARTARPSEQLALRFLGDADAGTQR